MNPEFIDWLADLKPSQWIMYANSYGYESYMSGINNGEILEKNFQDFHDIKPGSIKELKQIQIMPTFQEWLLDCFNREAGEKYKMERIKGAKLIASDLKITDTTVWQGRLYVGTEQGLFVLVNEPEPHLEQIEFKLSEKIQGEDNGN